MEARQTPSPGTATDEDTRVADFNHFVVFDPRNLLACHDFRYIDLVPDPRNVSCHSSYRNVSGRDETARWARVARRVGAMRCAVGVVGCAW